MDNSDGLMAKAIELAERSIDEDDRNHPKVGALLANASGEILLTAYRGERGSGDHAEYLLLKKAEQNQMELGSCAIFTTLEPCVRRGPNKQPCANRIIGSGIKLVYVGMVDPNPAIRGIGLHELIMGGISVRFASPENYQKICNLNSQFISQFPLTA